MVLRSWTKVTTLCSGLEQFLERLLMEFFWNYPLHSNRKVQERATMIALHKRRFFLARPAILITLRTARHNRTKEVPHGYCQKGTGGGILNSKSSESHKSSSWPWRCWPSGSSKDGMHGLDVLAFCSKTSFGGMAVYYHVCRRIVPFAHPGKRSDDPCGNQ